MMGIRTEKEAFEAIMRRFNFDKCAVAMNAVKWPLPQQPITADHLRASARQRFETLEGDPECVSTYSGGLRLSRDSHDGHRFLVLEFVFEDSESILGAV